MKRVLCLVLVLALCLSPALAAEGDLFPAAENTYPDFADVADDAWFADAVRICYEAGLMNGMSADEFGPFGTMTVAQAATIAARIREAVTGQPIPHATPLAGETRAWYDDYIDYLVAAGVSVGQANQQATRAQLFAYLAAVVPEGDLPAINTITALPDSSDPAVLRFYNAGILTGVDSYGTFNASGALNRAECATMVARIIRPALRKHFTPAEKPAAPAGPSYQEELDGTVAMLVNGKSVSLSDFVTRLDTLIFNADRNVYNSTGLRLDWNTDYGVGDLSDFFIEQTTSALIYDIVLDQQAKALGCQSEDLAALLSPNPSREVLSAYASGLGYMAAKHILLQTTPTGGTYSPETAQTLAQQIIDTIASRSDSEMARVEFENLLVMYNDDPGMTSNPNGYLFKSGEMVSEFENAVLALDPGSYSPEPVASVYGYHVILRLDPADLPEVKADYQDAVLQSLANSWADESTVTLNSVMLSQLDVRGCYDAFLQLLTQQ